MANTLLQRKNTNPYLKQVATPLTWGMLEGFTHMMFNLVISTFEVDSSARFYYQNVRFCLHICQIIGYNHIFTMCLILKPEKAVIYSPIYENSYTLATSCSMYIKQIHINPRSFGHHISTPRSKLMHTWLSFAAVLYSISFGCYTFCVNNHYTMGRCE